MQDIGILMDAALPFIAIGGVLMVIVFALWVIYKKRGANDAEKEENEFDQEYEIDEEAFYQKE